MPSISLDEKYFIVGVNAGRFTRDLRVESDEEALVRTDLQQRPQPAGGDPDLLRHLPLGRLPGRFALVHPSAGKGDLARVVRKVWAAENERNAELAGALVEKGRDGGVPGAVPERAPVI